MGDIEFPSCTEAITLTNTNTSQQWIATGRIGTEVSLRETKSREDKPGVAVCNFQLVVERSYMSPTGLKIEEDYFPITLWGDEARRAKMQLQEGDLLYIRGIIKRVKKQVRGGEVHDTFEILPDNFQLLSRPSAINVQPNA